MGNQNCNQCVENRHESKAYGQFELQKEGCNCYVVVEKRVQRDPELERKVAQQLQQRKGIKCTHIVPLHRYQLRKESFGFSVLMWYEYFPQTLKDRIHQVTSNHSHFTERELFGVIHAVQNALHTLNEHGIRHGCINSETVVCRNHFYKLTDVSSTTYVTSYDLARRGNRDQFLSERLLTNLTYKSLEPHYELKDDLFSLGMMVAMMVTKGHPGDFYSWNDNNNTATLKYSVVELALKEIENRYSHKLANRVRGLISDETEEEDKSQVTTLTEELADIQHNMARVLAKCRRKPN